MPEAEENSFGLKEKISRGSVSHLQFRYLRCRSRSIRGSRSASAIPDSVSDKENEGMDRMHACMDGWIDE